MKNIKIGKIGENIANEYLLNKTYLILARNHKEKFDEIDIIARHQHGILVFCEVKTINKAEDTLFQGLMPEDNLSEIKRRKMIRAAQIFIMRHPGLVWEDRGWQMDLIAILLGNGEFMDLRHYENI